MQVIIFNSNKTINAHIYTILIKINFINGKGILQRGGLKKHHCGKSGIHSNWPYLAKNELIFHQLMGKFLMIYFHLSSEQHLNNYGCGWATRGVWENLGPDTHWPLTLDYSTCLVACLPASSLPHLINPPCTCCQNNFPKNQLPHANCLFPRNITK